MQRERDQCGRVHPGLISLSWRTIRSLKVHIAFFRQGGGRRFFLSHLFSYSFASARRGASRRQREVIIIHSSRHCFKIQSTWHHCYARVVCLSLDPHSIGAVSERARGSTYYCVPWVFKNNDLDFKSRTTSTTTTSPPAQTRLTRLRAREKIFHRQAHMPLCLSTKVSTLQL